MPTTDGRVHGASSSARRPAGRARTPRRPQATHPVAESVRIGRAADNDIVLDDLQVSRHHAELLRRDAHAFEIVDLRSHHGTYVNGKRVTRQPIGELDVISIGRHRFRLVEEHLEEYVDTGGVTLAVSGLTVVRRGHTLLHEVSFELHEREFLAVLGPSGCGKSTLIKALNGSQPASSGAVFYDGRDFYEHYDELCFRIGYVPQDDVLQPDLTVHRALSYAAQLRLAGDITAEQRETRIEEVLTELGMAGRAGTRIANLSGGERKRVSVAMELLTQPSMLFLDEPTSGLDPGHERALIDVLASLARNGRTIVLVTHSVDSLATCDRCLFLAPGGKLAYAGIPLMAPEYFEQPDLPSVFLRLAEEPDVDWSAQLASRDEARPDFDPNAAMSSAGAVPVMPSPEPSQPDRKGQRTAVDQMTVSPGWRRQTAVLTQRYVRLLRATNLKLLLLQAPILGLLMLVALPAHELAPPPAGIVRVVSRAPLVLLVLVLAATWLGASNSTQEIVKELPTLRRERAAGLSLSAYLTSKVLVLSALTLVQTTVMTAIALARQGWPLSGSALGSAPVEIFVAAALAGVAGMALGLLVSASAGRPYRAIAVLPVVLILEMLLAMGGLFPDVINHPVLKQATYLASTSWTFDAAGSTADINRLQALANVTHDVDVNALVRAPLLGDLERPDPHLEAALAKLLNPGDARLDHRASAWWQDVAAASALTIAMLAGAAVALRRQTHPSRT